MTNAQSRQISDVDLQPILKLYIDGVEAWKRNYDQFVDTTKAAQIFDSQGRVLSVNPRETDAQKSPAGFFRWHIRNQIELCRFYSTRWEQYLTLPDQLRECRTIADFTMLQSAFMTKMMNDYMDEGRRLAEPMLELMGTSEMPRV